MCNENENSDSRIPDSIYYNGVRLDRLSFVAETCEGLFTANGTVREEAKDAVTMANVLWEELCDCVANWDEPEEDEDWEDEDEEETPNDSILKELALSAFQLAKLKDHVLKIRSWINDEADFADLVAACDHAIQDCGGEKSAAESEKMMDFFRAYQRYQEGAQLESDDVIIASLCEDLVKTKEFIVNLQRWINVNSTPEDFNQGIAALVNWINAQGPDPYPTPKPTYESELFDDE